ncbi:MAG: hypothetical protein GY827_03760 [Cytophagales bacterium]|nr:hypothetical protein [Cytophagales bacterium]
MTYDFFENECGCEIDTNEITYNYGEVENYNQRILISEYDTSLHLLECAFRLDKFLDEFKIIDSINIHTNRKITVELGFYAHKKESEYRKKVVLAFFERYFREAKLKTIVFVFKNYGCVEDIDIQLYGYIKKLDFVKAKVVKIE